MSKVSVVFCPYEGRPQIMMTDGTEEILRRLVGGDRIRIIWICPGIRLVINEDEENSREHPNYHVHNGLYFGNVAFIGTARRNAPYQSLKTDNLQWLIGAGYISLMDMQGGDSDATGV